MYGNARDRIMEELRPVPGIACYGSVEQAAHALGQLYRYHQALSRPLESWERWESTAPPTSPANITILGQEALEFLADHEIPSITGQLTHTLNQAVVAAASFGLSGSAKSYFCRIYS